MIKLLIPLSLFTLFSAHTFAEDNAKNKSYEAVFSNLALGCIHKEYTNKIAHFINSDDDIKPPRELYPAFYGCFDWHSSVHGHWLLVRMLNTSSDKVDTATIIKKLGQSFTAENIAGELANYQRPGLSSFERPYGIAWLFQLTAELRQASFPEAKVWLQNLLPLEQQAVANISDWLPKLAFPIRTGEHSQTAFAFGLMLDWSRIAGDKDFENLLTARIRELYLKNEDCPLAYEPSGQDFLSPCIAQADLMRRVMDKSTFAKWLSTFLPSLQRDSSTDWLVPAVVTDKSDGKLAHLDGLNTSRAWMLEGIISGLPDNDPRIAALKLAVESHRKTGLEAVLGEMH
ncbi:MAG: DUF2891 domain-containing protein, partial [Pseudomonadota bacterium]